MTQGDSASLANPAARSSSAMAMLPRIELMRACYGGTEAMRQMTTRFLPKQRRETDEDYQNRLNSTTAVNKLREAVDTASAKPFTNMIGLNGANEKLTGWMEDADLQGNHLHLVAREFFDEAILTGLSHLIVDYPTTEGLANYAVQKASKIRPFMRGVKAEDMLAVYHERIGGVRTITHARIASTKYEFNRETFQEELWDIVFVLEPGLVQRWKRKRGTVFGRPGFAYLGQGGSILTPNPLPYRFEMVDPGIGGGWIFEGERKVDLKRVPLVTMTAGDEESDGVVRPIFQDLAYKQIEHWQSSSEQRVILSAARFPMLAASGINLETEIDEDGRVVFEIGPNKILTTPDPQGRWYFIECEGKSIEAGRKDIEALEMQMDMLSLNPIISQPSKQYVAQNERSITETRVNTVVRDLAITAKDALHQAITLMGEWVGEDYSGVTLDMNFDFSGTDQKAKNIGSIIQAMAMKGLSRQGGLEELKRLNLLSDEFDIEAEVARKIEDMAGDPPPPPAPKSERDFPGGKTRPN
ncbi:DUF4055 domain-containing protein [Methylobacterium indicum]|uniref:DUF4055 domain-containing protein n=1 Tax=Methylobacterium indicum TaxID=1775910 RepID=A0A8H8X0B0_9HYPH|nr:DUF4055 domain-containing protein [Methylobacterium indicum]BCM87735.1 hypothetical protein mvi_61960 [Methylobacterium indicum]